MNLPQKKAIEYSILKHPNIKRFRIGFTSDGEPLLNWRVIKSVKEYCSELEKEKDIIFEYFSLATNGTLFNDDIINDICDGRQKIILSVDGPKETHNNHRIFTSGKGSYDLVENNIRKYSSRIKDEFLRVHTVLTSENTDVTRILVHLVEMGFDFIMIRPVLASESKKFSLNETSLEKFKKGYSDLAVFILEKLKERDYRYFFPLLNKRDIFGRYIIKLLERKKAHYGCTWIDTSITVDTNGDIYPCREFIGVEGFKIGDLTEGLDARKIEKFLSINVDERSVCNQCWARYLCGGGCYKSAHYKNKDIFQPDLVLCELTKHIIEECIKLIKNLEEYDESIIMDIKEYLQKRKRFGESFR
jgi:uncharacterized protein